MYRGRRHHYNGSAWQTPAYLSVSTDGRLGVGTDAPAAGHKLDVAGPIRAPSLTDRDNATYQVDPNGTTKLWYLDAYRLNHDFTGGYYNVYSPLVYTPSGWQNILVGRGRKSGRMLCCRERP